MYILPLIVYTILVDKDTPQCCQSHKILSEKNRQIKYGGQFTDISNDYRLGDKWYRFIFPDNLYAKIPTSPPELHFQVDRKVCGTKLAAWMNGTLPGLTDPQPVTREICFAWQGNTCGHKEYHNRFNKQTNTTEQHEVRYKTTTRVTACSRGGNTFYLYKLKRTPYCCGMHAMYCAI